MDIIIKENYYSTRSDFIREAIRDKLKELEKKRAIKKLEKYLGCMKKKTTYQEERRIREEVGKKYAKKFGIKLD